MLQILLLSLALGAAAAALTWMLIPLALLAAVTFVMAAALPFLRINHAQLADFRPIMPRNVKQSSIADLTAHLRVKRRAIENNVYFAGLFSLQHCFDN